MSCLGDIWNSLKLVFHVYNLIHNMFFDSQCGNCNESIRIIAVKILFLVYILAIFYDKV